MVDFSHLLTKQWYILIVVVVGGRRRLHLGQALEVGAAALGCLQAPHPDEDR